MFAGDSNAKGQVKGMANEAEGRVKGMANEVEGRSKGLINQAEGKVSWTRFLKHVISEHSKCFSVWCGSFVPFRFVFVLLDWGWWWWCFIGSWIGGQGEGSIQWSDGRCKEGSQVNGFWRREIASSGIIAHLFYVTHGNDVKLFSILNIPNNERNTSKSQLPHSDGYCLWLVAVNFWVWSLFLTIMWQLLHSSQRWPPSDYFPFLSVVELPRDIDSDSDTNQMGHERRFRGGSKVVYDLAWTYI